MAGPELQVIMHSYQLVNFVISKAAITPPLWPSGEAFSSRAANLRSNPCFPAGLSPGRVIPVTPELALQWLSCMAPGVIGSALGLDESLSAYWDWV